MKKHVELVASFKAAADPLLAKEPGHRSAQDLATLTQSLKEFFKQAYNFTSFSPIFYHWFVRELMLKQVDAGKPFIRAYQEVKIVAILLRGDLTVVLKRNKPYYDVVRGKVRKIFSYPQDKLVGEQAQLTSLFFLECLEGEDKVKPYFSLIARSVCQLLLIPQRALRAAIRARFEFMRTRARCQIVERLNLYIRPENMNAVVAGSKVFGYKDGDQLVKRYSVAKGIFIVIEGNFQTSGLQNSKAFGPGELVGVHQLMRDQYHQEQLECVSTYGEVVLIPKAIASKYILKLQESELQAKELEEEIWRRFINKKVKRRKSSKKACLPPQAFEQAKQKARMLSARSHLSQHTTNFCDNSSVSSRTRLKKMREDEVESKLLRKELVHYPFSDRSLPKPPLPEFDRDASPPEQRVRLNKLIEQCLPNHDQRSPSSRMAVARSLKNLKRLQNYDCSFQRLIVELQ